MLSRLRSPAVPLLAGIVLLVVLAALTAIGDSAVDVGQGWTPARDQEPQQPPDTSGVQDEDLELNTPPLIRAVMAGLFMVLLLVVGGLFVFGVIAIVLGFNVERRRRRRNESVAPVEEAEDDERADLDIMRRAAGHAMDRLLDGEGGEPGDAVVRAWLVLEEAAADAGRARRPHQTATEFTTGVLAGLDVDADALGRLRLLYQRARFSERPVTEDDVDAARRALLAVTADLDAGRRRTAERAAAERAEIERAAAARTTGSGT